MARVAKPLVAVIAISAFISRSHADDWRDRLPKGSVSDYLQEISVTVSSGRSEGSGILFSRDGQSFVWTAAHVVEPLRYVDTVINSGRDYKVVMFKDAQVVRQLVESGRKVGQLMIDAQIVKYSRTEDLAVLKLRKTGFSDASAVFWPDDNIVPIGTQLYHVGSLLGQFGAQSMTSGIQSQIGRILDGKEYDQTTVTAFPGSSGGGVYTHDGACIGMVVRGAGEGFNLIVPSRRIWRWARKSGVLWAMDPSAPLPDEYGTSVESEPDVVEK